LTRQTKMVELSRKNGKKNWGIRGKRAGIGQERGVWKSSKLLYTAGSHKTYSRTEGSFGGPGTKQSGAIGKKFKEKL